MNNKTPLIVLLMACTLGAQKFIQLGRNLKLHSLSELHQLETNQLECSPMLGEVSTSFYAWSEILDNQDQLNKDSSNLKQLKVLLQDFRGNDYDGAESILLQFRNSFSDIINQISEEQLQITPYQGWRKESAIELQGVVSLLDTAENKKDLELCCDKIEELIDRLIIEREQVKNQNQKKLQTTINIINSKADEVRKITKECSSGQRTIVKIKIKEDRHVVITGEPDDQQQGQEQKNKPIQSSESVRIIPAYRVLQGDYSLTSSSTTDEDYSDQMKPSEFTNLDPVDQKETLSSETFTEYGYGYWAKFLLAYPKFLPSGKDAPWYFVSRLSADQQDQDITMGSRLLAVFLGQGYYLFATCQQNSNPNIYQEVNYPVDLDGVWTYIYYSYSAEKHKAVAFIKFGSGNLKTVTHQVVNPSTNWVRFTIGGQDKQRFYGFNGLFLQIYFSTNPGVFLDCENDIISKLRQYPQPKDFLSKLITYKLVSNIQSRDPDTIEVFSIVGTPNNNPQFPYEYAFSGWFKWELLNQQQEWHIIFRVHIQQLFTDELLGDRTLAAFVGNNNGGIIHLATYTYTNLEGAGNKNVAQNILHQNRHTEWFFVYFGYSRHEKKAVASIQWKQSADKKEYDNVKHFKVPQFLIYVGKDPKFPGFNGKMELVSFNIGEGLNIQIFGDYWVYMSIIDLIYQFKQNSDQQSGCSNFIDGTCFNCFEGWDYLDLINQCIPICGDNLILGTEDCDDGNLIPFDGCFNCKFQCAKNCQICQFGRCIQCLFGYRLKSQYCYPVCGDALIQDSEECDDGNNEKFDGCYNCKNSCQIECKLCVNQQCFQCLDGWQLISNKCEQVCDDNLLAILSIEQCDNVDDIYCNDCLLLCQDNCISCLAYNQCLFCRQPFQLVNGICTSTCGDSIVQVGFEQCDDGNDIKFDGCYKCQFQCSYGCILCQNNNICIQCDPQFTKLNNRTMKCEQIDDDIEIYEEIVEDNDNQCGNGMLNSLYEDCDDGNIVGGDGCSAYCNIEASFICTYVEGSLSICTYLETPKFKLESLSNKKSQLQILQLSFTQKVRLSSGFAFENITIFTVFPTIKYDINIIPLVECSTEFNQSKYQISIFFRDPVENPVLKVEIEKSMIINELNQYLVDNKQEINLGNPFVLSETTQQTVTKIVSMNDAMIYTMISISGFVLLTGNTMMFLNLLDLLQSLSYLRYMQYQFPQHLKQFLDTYIKISLQPILDFLNVDVFISKLNGGIVKQNFIFIINFLNYLTYSYIDNQIKIYHHPIHCL